ncbi:MAG: hypothetical protein MUW56_19310 [Chryseobacterium sp.]|uniref:hypothetical protein n=1 Tax=Chryseobacterium sp. TaxID=1871047 RepID=UPI0025B954ED|nr:hypothetical protein [Chryseobacterium sp.]MCJ7935711.1 hypothetical protein [Chryseobacterium sp.]
MAVPSLQIAVAASIAESLEKARRNAYGMAYQFLQSRQLVSPDVLFPSEIVEQKILGTKDEEEFFTILNRMIIETPESVSGRLQQIAEKYNTDDILVLCNMYREKDRISTYQHLIKNNL